MSYVSGYRTRGMASLGAEPSLTLYAVTVWDWNKKCGRTIKGKCYDGGEIYSVVSKGKEAAVADLARVTRLYDNKGKKPGHGARYLFNMKVVGFQAGAHVGTPKVDNSKLLQLGPRGVTRGGGSGATASNAPLISRGDDRDDSSSGGGGGGGVAPPSAPSSAAPQEVETENVAVTDEGPVPATSSGRPVSTAPAPLQTSTMLLIGGGLLAAYLLFGRKSR
jgi:hypothetical protein